MPKVQTRKSISLSRATYDAATAAAAREGIATAEWVTRLIRKACPELAEQRHASAPPLVVLHVAAATPEPPPRTRLELDRMAAERKRTVKPGTFCANCIERKATHRGRIDLSGAIYDLCDECELPKNEEREGWHEQRGTR